MSKTMNDIMIDIETLGTAPGSVILTCACVRFDRLTGDIGSEDLFHIDLASSMSFARVEANTLQWWMQQSKEASKELFGAKALSALEFINRLSSILRPTDKVWANSPGFDMQLIGAYYRYHKKDIPWKFYNEMDVRTLKNLVPSAGALSFEGTAHNALDDCKHQIKQVVTALRYLGL